MYFFARFSLAISKLKATSVIPAFFNSTNCSIGGKIHIKLRGLFLKYSSSFKYFANCLILSQIVSLRQVPPPIRMCLNDIFLFLNNFKASYILFKSKFSSDAGTSQNAHPRPKFLNSQPLIILIRNRSVAKYNIVLLSSDRKFNESSSTLIFPSFSL